MTTEAGGVVVVDLPELTSWCADALVGRGVGVEDAVMAAGVLVRTTSRGYVSHGVALLPLYLRWLDAGVIDPAAVVRPASSTGPTETLDGGGGMGQVVAHRATTRAVELAREHGIAMVAVRNSNHFGAAGHYALLCAERGFIGLAWSSAPPTMHAPGGRGRAVGNGPTAYAVPAPPEPPLVFDAAMSVGSGGKVALARARGEEVPAGWLLDALGRPTVDPDAAGPGSFVPIGDHKGFGLALLAEVLSSCLSGAALTGSLPPMQGADRPFDMGHAFLVIDPTAFGGLEDCARRVNELRASLRASAPVGAGVRLPGDRAAEQERRSAAEGLAVERSLLDAIGAPPVPPTVGATEST